MTTRSAHPFEGEPVLVTGGAGFVGANLCYRLVQLGAQVHVPLKKTTLLWRLQPLGSKVREHAVSLTDRTVLKDLVKAVKPRYVFHLAARGAYSDQDDVADIITGNLEATANLLVALKEIPLKGFVQAGSSSEYGFKRHPMRENELLEPVSFYAATKAAATHLAQVFSLREGVPAVTLRLFSAYGPWEEPKRLIPAIIARALAHQPLLLTQGHERHDFVYVDDIVDAFLLAAQKAQQHQGKIFNVGTGKQYSIKEVVAELQKQLGPLDCQWGAYPGRKWDTDYWVADPSYTKKTLGWKAATTFPNGLKKMTAWVKAHNDLGKG